MSDLCVEQKYEKMEDQFLSGAPYLQSPVASNKEVRRTADQMYPLVEQWRQSGQSKTAFCRLHQLNIHTFGYWVSKKRQEEQQSSTSDFIALSIKPVSRECPELQIHYPNGAKICFQVGTSTDYVRSLLQIRL